MAGVITGFTPAGHTAELIHTGSSVNPQSGDTVLITGPGAAQDVILSDDLTLRVSDLINVTGNLSLNNRTGITFKPASATAANQWAVMEYTGAALARSFGLLNGNIPTAESGTQTLSFNNVVFMGGQESGGGALSYRGSTANELVLDGNIAFINNTVNDNTGGAIYLEGSITFTGTAIFAGNRVGWNNATSTFAYARGGGAIIFRQADAVIKQAVTFNDTAIFLSNTAAGAGGALFGTGANNFFIFEKEAIFKNNTAGALGTAQNGGAVNMGASSALLFKDDVTFEGNRTTGAGGAMYLSANVTVGFGGGVTFKNNQTSMANTDGGAIYSAASGPKILIDQGGYLFSGNYSIRDGSAIYSGSGGGVTLQSSGTFSNNIAGRNGVIFSLADVFIGSGAVFENNSLVAAGGGAVYMNAANTTLTLSAQTDDIVFRGSTQSGTVTTDPGSGSITVAGGTPGNGIYIAYSSTLVFDAAAGRKIRMEDAIAAHTTNAASMPIIKKGAGEVIFSNTTLRSRIAGAVAVQEGVFAVADGATFGESSAVGSFTVTSGGTLAGNGIVQTGTAVLESGATLEVRDDGFLRFNTNTAYTPGSGLILAGSGTIRADNAGGLNVAKIRVGESAGSAQAQTLTLVDNNITLAGGAVLQFDLDAGSASDSLFVNNLTLAGGAVIDLGWVESGSFSLLSWNTAGLSGTAGLSLSTNGAALTARNNAALGVDAAAKTLFLTNEVFSLGLQWTGADPARVWKSSPSTDGNWGDNGATGEKYFINGDSVTFGTAGQGTVSLDGVVTASEMNVTGGDYTFSGTGGIITSSTSVLASSAITGSGTTGKLVKTGAGVLAFANSGSNTFEGGIEIGGGAIAYGNAAQLGVGAGHVIEFTGSGTLRADAASGATTGTLFAGINIVAGRTAVLDTQSFAVDYAGALSGAATSVFAKTGSGALTLAGDSSAFSGTTRIDAGALLLATTSRLGGVVLVKNGVLLGGSGSAAVVTTESGAILQTGAPGGTDALKVGTLNLAAGSTVKFSLVTGGSTAALSQNSKLEAATVNLLAGAGDMSAYTLNLSSILPGIYDLGSGTALAGARVTQGNNLELSERQFATFSTTTQPGRLLLTLEQAGNDLMTWTGSVGATWATGKNWLDSSARSLAFIDGDAVIFQTGSLAQAQREVDVNSTLAASDMRVDGTAALRFHGVGSITTNPALGTLSGSAGIDGKLKKSGAGVLSFENTGDNFFIGGIDISGGVIEFNNGGQLATGAGIAFLDSATLRPVVSATLGGKLNVADGKRAVFDVLGAADTLVWTGTFDAATSGTLAKTGSGALVLAGASYNPHGVLEVAEGGLFMGGTGALVGGTISVAPGATFGGVGNPLDTVVIAGGATLRVGLPGTSGTMLAIPRLVLQDGALITGAGVLAGGTGTLSGRTEADIAPGAQLRLVTTLAGTGTLAKLGDGTLVYGSPGVLGHAATEINAGLVMLRGIADPSAVSHSFILNGGWLDLSETPYVGDGSTANDWSGLSFSGSLGAVIGSNDKITLGEGTHRFQIGGTTTASRGVFVVVDAGSGTAVLTGANSYVGLTRIKSGVLAVSDDAQLGDTTLARPVVFEGGALLATEGINTRRVMELAGSGTLLVAAGKTSTWAGSSGTGILTKAGPGTLVVSAPLANNDGVTVIGGVLRGSPANLSGWIHNQATVEIATSGSLISTLAGFIDGDLGAVVVLGGGTLALDGSKIISAGSLGVRAGGLVLTGTVPFTLQNRLEIGSPSGAITNATLIAASGATINTPLFSNKGAVLVGKAAGGPDFATLEINGDYTGYGRITLGVLANGKEKNLIVDADRVRVSGSATGETYVVLNLALTGTAAADPDAGGAKTLQLIEAAGGVDSGYTFQLSARYTNGPYEFMLSPDGMLSTSVISPELPLVLGTDVASILVGKAALDSLAGRLALTRITEPRAWDLWVNGLYRYDRLTSDDYDGSTVRTQGVQAGVDKHWERDKWGLTAGLFFDYASADMRVADVNKSTTETTANGAGVYLSYARKSLYVDTVFRVAEEDYTIKVPGTPSFDTKGSSQAVAVEFGWASKMRSIEEIGPYAGLRWQTHDIDDATDSFGRIYKISGAESLEGRVGVRMWDRFDLGRKRTLFPHFGIAVVNEFKGDSSVTVDTSQVNINHEFRDNRIQGAGAMLEAGATLQLGERCAINLEGAWYIAEKMENATVNFGLRYMW
jgi:outer membrane autotransporter protein